MKFFKKLLTVALTGVMSLSVLGGLSINAEETATTEKVYKLSELLPMSKEEFLQLKGAEELYNKYIKISNETAINHPSFMCNAIRDGGENYYKPYYTEKK